MDELLEEKSKASEKILHHKSEEKLLIPVNKITAIIAICIALTIFFCYASFHANSRDKNLKQNAKDLCACEKLEFKNNSKN